MHDVAGRGLGVRQWVKQRSRMKWKEEEKGLCARIVETWP